MNFDKIIDRKESDCIKYDKSRAFLGYQDLLPMWVADMDFECPDFVLEAIRKRTEHPILGYSFRPDSYFGAIIDWLKRRHQWTVKAEEISFCPGVVSGIFLALKAFSQVKDEIIAQPPVYFPFFSTVEENQRILTLNPLKEKDLYYEMDFEDLRSKITEKTKMILLSNPHNPVGRAWKAEELIQLVDICYEKNIIILSDEIHADLTLPPHRHQVLSNVNQKAKEITITFMAPSKTFNLAGLSSSIVISQNPELLKAYIKELEATHLGLGNIFGSVATEAAYRHGDLWLDALKDYIIENAKLVHNFTQEHAEVIQMRMPEATYLLWLDLRQSGLDDEGIKQLFFKEAKLGINTGTLFGQGGEGFVRMNIAMPRARIQQALVQLENAIERFKLEKKL